MSDKPETTTRPAKSLRDLVLDALQQKPGLKASDLARTVGRERREVNRCLHYELAGLVQQGNDYRWRLAQRDSQSAPSASTPTSEISRLCRYYLECISQDMDEGASVFARNQYGDPEYVQLASVPLGSGAEWWNWPGVGRLLAKGRGGRGKLMLWLG